MNPKKNFRTADDDKRTQKAASLVSRMQTMVDAAASTVVDAETACTSDPTDAAFASVRKARSALFDATADLDLAKTAAAKVESEIATAERGRIRDEIARLEGVLTEVATEETRELAVEIRRSR